MGRACVCCEGECLDDKFYFHVDRYGAQVDCFVNETIEFFQLKWNLSKGETENDAETTNLQNDKIVRTYKDQQPIAANTYRTEVHSSERVSENGQTIQYKTYKKITVLRKLALSFYVDDVFDWNDTNSDGIDFVNKIYFRFGNVNDRTMDGETDWAATSDYSSFNGIYNQIPTSMAMFDNMLPQAPFSFDIKWFDRIGLDVTSFSPRTNGNFVILITPKDVEVKSPLLEGEDEPGSLMRFGSWSSATNIIWLELHRPKEYKDRDDPNPRFDGQEIIDGQVSEWIYDHKNNIEYDWHDCFNRIEKLDGSAEYVSSCKYMDVYFDFDKFLDFDYFEEGSKLEIEFFRAKTDNTKAGARESYVEAVYELVYNELIVYEQILSYNCVVEDENFVYKITDASKEVEKYWDLLAPIPDTINPCSEPDNGLYHVAKGIPKEIDLDNINSDGFFYGYRPYAWDWKYSYDGTSVVLSEYSTIFNDLTQRPPATYDGLFGLISDFLLYDQFIVSLDRWFIRDCVIESTGGKIRGIGEKQYYDRVPHYGEFSPASLRFKLIDHEFFPDVLSVNGVYNDRTGNNIECPDVSCVGGPAVLEWDVLNETFEAAGTSTSHNVYYHGCANRIVSVKQPPSWDGGYELAVTAGSNYAVYEPSLTEVYFLSTENGDPYDRNISPDKLSLEMMPCGNIINLFNHTPCRSGEFRILNDITNCANQVWSEYIELAQGRLWTRKYDANIKYVGLCGLAPDQAGCITWMSGYDIGYSVSAVLDIVAQDTYGNATIENPVSNSITNDFATVHEIETTEEPYSLTTFLDGAAVSWYNLIQDFVLDSPIGASSLDGRPPSKRVLRDTYVPGTGIRFRLPDDFFDCLEEKYATEADYNILYQEYLPILYVEIGENTQLTEEEIGGVAGYITDFNYWYQLLGEVFVEDPQGEDVKDIDGELVVGRYVTDGYFYIDGSGNLNGPFTSHGFVYTLPDLRVTDTVTINFDGYSSYSALQFFGKEWDDDEDLDAPRTDLPKCSTIKKETRNEYDSSFPGNIFTDAFVPRYNHKIPTYCGFENQEGAGAWGEPGSHVEYSVSITIPIRQPPAGSPIDWKCLNEYWCGHVVDSTHDVCENRVAISPYPVEDVCVTAYNPFSEKVFTQLWTSPDVFYSAATCEVTGSYRTIPTSNFDNQYTKTTVGSSSAGTVETFVGLTPYQDSTVVQYKKVVDRFNCGNIPTINFTKNNLVHSTPECNEYPDIYITSSVELKQYEYKYGIVGNTDENRERIQEIDGVLALVTYNPSVDHYQLSPNITIGPAPAPFPSESCGASFQNEKYGCDDSLAIAADKLGVSINTIRQWMWNYTKSDVCHIGRRFFGDFPEYERVTPNDPCPLEAIETVLPSDVSHSPLSCKHVPIGVDRNQCAPIEVREQAKKTSINGYQFTIGKKE